MMKKKLLSRKGFWFTLFILVLVVAVALFYMLVVSGWNWDEEEINLPVSLVQVEQRNISTFDEFPASLEGESDVEVFPMVDGYLEEIYVDEGQFVQKKALRFSGSTTAFTDSNTFRPRL